MIHLGKNDNFPSWKFRNNIKEYFPECDKTVYRSIFEQNKNRMEYTAITFQRQKISYSQLKCNTDKIADLLITYGVKENDIIFVCNNTSLELVYLCLACSKIGAVVKMLWPYEKEDVFNNYVEKCSPKLIFVLDYFFPNFVSYAALQKFNKVIIMSYNNKNDDNVLPINNIKLDNLLNWDDFYDSKIINTAKEIQNGQYVYTISATTGTTGTPKSVVVTNYSYNALSKNLNDSGLTWKAKDKIFSCLPSFVVTGLSLMLFSALSLGMNVILNARLNAPEKFFDDVDRFKPDIVCGTKSTLLHSIHDNTKQYDLSYVSKVYSFGEVLNQYEYSHIKAWLKDRKFNNEISELYGMSELNSTVVYDCIEENKSIIKLLPYINVAVVDMCTCSELPFDNTGLLFVKSPSVMQGYHLDKEVNDNIFEDDDNNNEWCCTGDIASVNEDGHLKIHGRYNNLSKNSSIRYIDMYAYNDCLSKIPGFLNSIALYVNDNNKEKLSLHVEFSNTNLSEAAIIKEINDTINADTSINVLPDLIKVWDIFPISVNLKTDIIKMKEDKSHYYAVSKEG